VLGLIAGPPFHVFCRCGETPETDLTAAIAPIDDGFGFEYTPPETGTGAGSAPGSAPVAVDPTPSQAGEVGDGKKQVDVLSSDPLFYNSNKETAYIYSDRGKLIAKVDGEDDRVDLSSIPSASVKDAHFTHNHPSRELSSDTWTFTYDDIETAFAGDFSTMTATGKYRTFTMSRPDAGWGDFADAITATKRKLKVADVYFDDFIRFRDGRSFGDTSEALNKEAKKFWKTFSDIVESKYTDKKRGN